MSCPTTLLDKAAAGIAAKRERVTKRKAEDAQDEAERDAIDRRIAVRACEITELNKKIAALAKLNAADDKVARSIDARKRQRRDEAAKDLAMAELLATYCTAATVETRKIGIMDYASGLHTFK